MKSKVSKKPALVIAACLVLIIILASIVLGTKILVRTQNKDFKKDPEFYKALGNSFVEKGDHVNAAVAYESCLLLGEDKDVRNNLAVIYYKQGKYSEAINQLSTLIQLEPNNPSYHYDLAVNLVDKFRNSQEQSLAYLEEALVEYERADSLQPGYANAKENIEVLKRVIGRQ
jgi:Flp pilus assembly protein TadD